jgi:hypothetical protein
LRGIREFPTAEALAVEIREHGFDDVAFERQSLGIVAIHTARKPPAKHRMSYELAVAALGAVSNQEEHRIVASTFSHVPKP